MHALLSVPVIRKFFADKSPLSRLANASSPALPFNDLEWVIVTTLRLLSRELAQNRITPETTSANATATLNPTSHF
jgi:hypothetical protein